MSQDIEIHKRKTKSKLVIVEVLYFTYVSSQTHTELSKLAICANLPPSKKAFLRLNRISCISICA